MYLDHPLSPPTDTSNYPPSPPSPPSESPDIARLRRTHTTQGYRDGITHGKATHLQDGFDEGYSLGGRFGLKLGWLLGAIEGLWFMARNEQLRREAQNELVLENIFAKEFFGSDGVWTYGVGVADDDMTLDVVVERHPVVRKWVLRVGEEARRCGLVVEELSEEGGKG